MKVLMLPMLKHFRSAESGIKRVVEAYYKYGPQFGIKFVDEGEHYDLKVSHAGTNVEQIDVAMLHGLYFTADYVASAWEWKANANVIEAARQAKIITVPSNWVAETISRDMRRTPVVVPHGIDRLEWEHDRPLGGYVLYNKNREGDVCSSDSLTELAPSFPDVRFVTTFAPKRKWRNIDEIGVIPHDQMKLLVQGAGVYLSTTKETFGIGTLEAMASGVPVLGYAHGGNLDLIEHGINGYLAKPDDIEDLVEGLAYCLKHRKTLGENGREMVKEYTWEKAMEKVAAVYQRALEPEEPTAAIIIPSYMYADKVGRAIKSAMRQTYSRVKDIVIVDDGSPDDGATEMAVREWAGEDSRIRYIRQENQGVAVARNTGIEHTDAKFICCLDADDAMEPEMVEKCVRELERDNSLGLAYTKIRHILSDGRTGVSPWPGEWDFDRQVQRANQVPTCNVFRRKVWQQLGGYKKRYCPIGAGSEDAEFWTRIGAYGWKCKLATAEPLFIYSLGSGRVSGNKDYSEPDWLAWHPWAADNQHPFASYVTPKRWSHPVRQYDEPVVSVIIPVGPDHQVALEDALDSLEAQSLRQWECIVVWDAEGSPPQRYTDAYPFVRWVELGDNYGAGYARNRGADLARADFLLFLDADDWLYPHTLDTMLDEWKQEEAVIYSDYVGKAFIDDPGELDEKLQKNIAWRQPDGLTAIYYEAPDYDVEKAQRQPHGDPNKVYTWNLITSLVPKAWHEEVGGFDERMDSWEDVDYWWRIAKAGKCFRKVEEPLVVYHFYTGKRRDFGHEQHQRLFQYLIDKHAREEITMCRGCGRGGRPKPSVARTQTASPPLALIDEQFKMVVYKHPNRGQHTVIGQAIFRDRIEGVHVVTDRNNQGFRIHYGFRGGGEKFLAHIEDIKIAPHLFAEIEQRPAAPVVERPVPDPPAPLREPQRMMEQVGEEMEEGGPPPAAKRINLNGIIGIDPRDGIQPEEQRAAMQVIRQYNEEHLGEKVAELQEMKSTDADDYYNLVKDFDLQKLPGVTARIAKRLDGYTLDDIVEMGEEGLQSIDRIGPTRARSIYAAAMEAISA